MIHPSSIVSSNAELGNSVRVGPFCIIDDNVKISDNTELISHVSISGKTTIGKNNIFYPFSSIGANPQDKKYIGEQSELIIGNNNIIREHVTINPGTKDGGMKTVIKNNCLIMIGSHIAHDCYISSNVILVNNATLGGHVNIDEHAIIGGNSAIHQFVNIGKYAMIGGMSGVENNIIPYGLYTGIRSDLRGLNIIGLKRKGLKSIIINDINSIVKKIFNKKNNIEFNIENLKNSEKKIMEVKEIIEFIKLNFKRGISRYIDE
jgi:UDP-N-acetylglucosamine acyltransferase